MEFEEAIKNGQILILVETEQNSVEEIQSVIKRHYAEADIKDSQHVSAPLIGKLDRLLKLSNVNARDYLSRHTSREFESII